MKILLTYYLRHKNLARLFAAAAMLCLFAALQGCSSNDSGTLLSLHESFPLP